MVDPSRSDLAQAETLAELRRWPEAAAATSEVLAREPDNGRALCLLARCHLGLGDAREAATWAERAVAADPLDEWPHRLRAVAALRLGEKSIARAAALESVRLAPDQVEGHLALVEAELANRKVKAAEATARRALALAPTDDRAHNAAGLVALRRRKPKVAEQHFREALGLDPESATAMNNLGLALERQGNKRAAIHYYAEASKLDPHDSLPRTNATRAARIGAVGGAIAASAVARAVLGSTADSEPEREHPDVPGSLVPIVVGPDGAGVPSTQPPRSPVESSEAAAPSGWAFVAAIAVAASVVAVTLWWRRRRELRSGHPLANRELIREIRRNDRRAGIEVRGSWLGTRALLAIGLLTTLSIASAGFASIADDGLSGWIFGVGGLAASAGLVRLFLPQLRRTR